MKFHWGHRITILFIAFGTMISTLVYKSVTTPFDLVSSEYYKEELAFQQIIDAGDNALRLSRKTQISVSGDSLFVQIPESPEGNISGGVILFYSPTDAKLDRRFVLSPSESNTYPIHRSLLRGSRYTVKADWTAGNKRYYTENDFVPK